MTSTFKPSKQLVVCFIAAALFFLQANAQNEALANAKFSDAQKDYDNAVSELHAPDYSLAADKNISIAGKLAGAAAKCVDSKSNLGKWAPATLALYLKCADQYLHVEHFEDATKWNMMIYEGPVFISYLSSEIFGYAKFRPSYDNYKELYDLSAALLADYPSDKAGEIKDIQARFKEQMDLTDFEHNLTPDDAVKFLNSCAQKFPAMVHFKKRKEVDELVQWNITFTDNRYLNFFAPQLPDKPAVKIDMTKISALALFDRDNAGIYDDRSIMFKTGSPCFVMQMSTEVIQIDKAFYYSGPWGKNSLGVLLDGFDCTTFEMTDGYIPFPNLKDMNEYWKERYPFRTARALLVLYEMARKTAEAQEVKQAPAPVKREFGF